MLPILSSEEIRAWDAYTIKNEPILSIDLMERASNVFADWFIEKYDGRNPKILIIASKGNNGGDGLAVARILTENAFDVEILIADIQAKSSKDFNINLKRLKDKRIEFEYLADDDIMPNFNKYDIIIDAIFGSGLSRPITGYWAKVIDNINHSHSKVFSIDIPSGMYADKITDGIAIKADDCMTFEVPKTSMLLSDNNHIIKNWSSKSIGLKKDFLQEIKPKSFYIKKQDIKNLLRPRNKFDHKGKYGHSLIIGGKKGMIGAAVLASKSCLRTGSGLVTALIPDCGYNIMQISAPEVMTITGFGDEFISALPNTNKYNTIGIGVGLGTNPKTVEVLEEILKMHFGSLVIDADALNILAENKNLLNNLPVNTIITPHPGEFARLFGPTKNSFERIELQRQKAKELNIFIILKGAYTSIASPKGKLYFNSTGNPGMATAGSGDVLTGILTSLLSQGYNSFEASIMGVFLHGLAGDIAATKSGFNALIAGDIIDNIGVAFKKIENY